MTVSHRSMRASPHPAQPTCVVDNRSGVGSQRRAAALQGHPSSSGGPCQLSEQRGSALQRAADAAQLRDGAIAVGAVQPGHRAQRPGGCLQLRAELLVQVAVGAAQQRVDCCDCQGQVGEGLGSRGRRGRACAAGLAGALGSRG
jgi:hypothetical protein